MIFFKQKTAYEMRESDWSSDVCSSDLPSVFMHAADAIHGDLGMVQQDDIIIVISKSGDSPEIKVLVPLIKNFGNILIGKIGRASCRERVCQYV